MACRGLLFFLQHGFSLKNQPLHLFLHERVPVDPVCGVPLPRGPGFSSPHLVSADPRPPAGAAEQRFWRTDEQSKPLWALRGGSLLASVVQLHPG